MAESKRFLLRLNPRLFEVLRRWADEDLRSINGQIEYLLTEQARRAGRLPRQTTRPPGESPTDDLDAEAAAMLDPAHDASGAESLRRGTQAADQ